MVKFKRSSLAQALRCALTVAALPLLLGESAALRAQSIDYGALEEVFGEAITTSVTGSPQRASVVPASMEIITAEDIRRSGAGDVPGVLRQVTGIDVLRWSASHSDVAVRGYNKAFSSRLLVLVNGRQIYADHYGYVPWAALPVELGEIRQIEVVKGPNSALFGFNAVGGVINIVTYSPDHDPVNFVSVKGGTQDTAELSAATTLQLNEKAHVLFSAGARESEDFDTPQRSNDAGVRQGDERYSLRVDFHYQVSPNVALEVEGSRTRATQSSMAPVYSMGYEMMNIRALKGNLAVDSRLGLTQATLYRNWIDNRVFVPLFDGQEYGITPEPLVIFDNQVSVAQLQQVFKPAVAHTVRLGAEYREGLLPTAPQAIATVSYDVLAYSAMWEWQLFSALTFTAAAREDRLHLDREGLIPNGFPLTNADWQRQIHATSFNAALVWQLGERDIIRLTAARGSQLPSLYSLGGSLFVFPMPPEFQPPPALFFTGLPSLSPTEVNSQELAWERQLELLPARLRLALFHGDSANIISDSGGVDYAAGIISAPANIGDSRTRGAELILDGSVGDSWRWRLGYIHQTIDDEFLLARYPVSASMANYADTTSEHTVNAGLGWSRGPWEVDAFLRYQSSFAGLHVDETYNFFDPTAVPKVLVPISDYTAVDLNLGYRINERLRVNVAGQNLLSSEQAQTSGPKVERRLQAVLNYSF